MSETKELKRTVKDLQEVDVIMGQIYAKDPALQQGKIGYAYKRFVEKNYQPAIKDLQEKLADVRIDHALVDEKTKEILLDKENPRGFKYDKAGLKAVIAAERKVAYEWDKQEIIITPYISKDVPKGLSEEDKEKLKGLII